MLEIFQKLAASKIGKEDNMEDTLEMHSTHIQQQHQLDITSILNLMERSKKAREKFVAFFLCKKKCAVCRDAQNLYCTEQPCIIDNFEFSFEGIMVKFALLTCVRSKDPVLREQAMTTFRKLTNIDDNLEGSDIKKMIDMPPNRLMQHLLDEVENLDLVSLLSKLAFSAVMVGILFNDNSQINFKIFRRL